MNTTTTTIIIVARATTEPLSWGELLELEPELAALELRADATRRLYACRPGWDGDAYWHGTVKRILIDLVGLYRRAPGPIALCTVAAYDLAYANLYYAATGAHPYGGRRE